MPEFLANGGDGYSMFKHESVQTVVDDENGLKIMDICKQFFKRTQTDYQIVPRRELARQIRFKAFGVDTEDQANGVSPDGMFYKLMPTTDRRIQIYTKEEGQTLDTNQVS